jgi:hypothetical protein
VDPLIPPGLEASELRITETHDGFSMGSAGAPFSPGARIRVDVAYETSKGNPFKAYKRHDFDLGQDVIVLEASGCEITKRDGNQILIAVQDPVFSLHVSGFDTNRDLLVKAKAEKTDAQSSANGEVRND